MVIEPVAEGGTEVVGVIRVVVVIEPVVEGGAVVGG